MAEFQGSILALDLATNTGFCVGAPGAEPTFGEHRLPKTGDDIGAFGCAFEDWLAARIAEWKPAYVIFEAPVLPKKTQLMTVRKLTGLAYDTEKICKRAKIVCREGHKQTVSKTFVGRGRVEKEETIRMARRYGFNVHGEDEADAVALWCYGLFCVAPAAAHARFGLGSLGAAA